MDVKIKCGPSYAKPDRQLKAFIRNISRRNISVTDFASKLTHVSQQSYWAS